MVLDSWMREKGIEDEEENLPVIENVTTSQNVWMIIFFMCTKIVSV